MIYRRSERFHKAFHDLPRNIQEKVINAFTLFRENPEHLSLVIKKIRGMEGVWEGRIDQKYRFTFHYEKDETTGETICVFRNLDNHDACLKNP
jgi:mRNA-degrading endonuclease RelE of RelBE toxin-antitoxin system